MSKTEKPENITEFKKTKPGQPKKRFIWALSVVFLVLVVVVFVFSPVVGAFVPTNDSIVFGEYDGIPIEYAYGNYFYEQQQQIAASWNQETTEDTYQWQVYQIWKSAFDNTVIHTAIVAEADKSGLSVTDKAVDDYLLTQGPYIDENGVFSAELYNQSSSTQRASVREEVRETLRFQTVIGDMFSSVTSPNEVEFIADMAKEEKSFDYVLFSLADYPQERAVSYAQANLMDFTEINISMITLASDDQEAADDLYSRLSSGEVLFEDAARNNSIDGFAEDGGEAGWFAFHDIAALFDTEQSAHEIFSLAPGQISALYSTDYGFNIFKVNDSPRVPDLEDAQVIAGIKDYIISTEADMVREYMSGVADEFTAVAREAGFESAVTQKGLSSFSAAPTPLNVGGSSFMKSFNYTDEGSYLTSMINNDQALSELYAVPEGGLSEPIEVDNGVLVAYCSEIAESTQGSESLAMFYPYLSQQIAQNDFTQLVFASDKLVDNFITVFFSQILQNS